MPADTKRDKAKKRSYTVKEGSRIQYGERITEKEMEAEGLPTQKRSRSYVGGDKIELTDAEAMSMRHALEDAPELTDAEVDMYAEQARMMGDDNPDRKAIAEAVKTRQAPSGPDFGRLPRDHEVNLMMAANKRQERENKASGVRKGAEGYQQVDSKAAGGGPANAGKPQGADAADK